jgi:hypothetical protein
MPSEKVGIRYKIPFAPQGQNGLEGRQHGRIHDGRRCRAGPPVVIAKAGAADEQYERDDEENAEFQVE